MSINRLNTFLDSLNAWERALSEASATASDAFPGVFGAAAEALEAALRYEGYALAGAEPKEVLRKAFAALWIDDAQLWLDMLTETQKRADHPREPIPPHRIHAYFTELHRIAEVMKTRPNVPSAVQDLAERIGRLPRVKRVILFGSRARGDNQPRSDVDLAVEVEDEAALQPARRLVEEAQTLLEIELVAMPDATPELRAEIEREGLVLFSRS
ncbi:MAG: nucleotidyltransferase domain-containing protein [Candidatus Sericytochromatia bacterium]|nr:nucleotidyltransferase domain-containing protein [Candidatus Sericytochromatia bacterium]